MRVFVSWSGERSQALAKALREWLPLVLHYAEPWLSQSDIDAGDRWGLEVAKELDVSAFGVSCITSENIAAPWLLFEAGALAKSLQEGRVVPLLLDVDFADISGPLAQFQAKKVERSGLLDTVVAINKVAAAPVAEARLHQLFGALWPDLEKTIAELPKAAAGAKRTRSQSEVLEELVSGVRSLDSKFRDVNEDGGPSKRSRRYRNIFIVEEMLDRYGFDGGQPMGMLVAAGMLRDDYPWVYDVVLDFFRACSSGKPAVIHGARRNIEVAIELFHRLPMESGHDSHAMHLLLRELRRFIDVPVRQQKAGTRELKVVKKGPENAA